MSARQPQLKAIDPPRLRPTTLPFVIVMAVLVAVGMAGMVVLTTVLQEQAFAVQAKQHQANTLANRASQLQAQLADARSIEHLVTAAQDLGMRPNPYAVPMRLSDGKVYGVARPVVGNEVPGVRYVSDQGAAQAGAKQSPPAKQAAGAPAANPAGTGTQQ